jgi:hypothetical protein
MFLLVLTHGLDDVVSHSTADYASAASQWMFAAAIDNEYEEEGGHNDGDNRNGCQVGRAIFLG